MSEEKKTVVLPEITQRILKLIDRNYNEVLLKLGNLEVEYDHNKGQLLAQIHTLKKEHMKTLSEAAKAAGADVDKERWLFDISAFTLTQEPVPSAQPSDTATQ